MKVTVIMPVYGVESYLPRAVESVRQQTFSDFELLLVDDCSPDGCPAMCDAFAGQDPRITVVHKPQNEGLGMARNTGLAHAAGDFVYFMDSDDWIAPDLLETCVPLLENGADIVAFGITRMHQNQQGETVRQEVLNARPQTAQTPGEIAAVFSEMNRAHTFPFVCNKMYRRSFLQACGVLFERTKLIEDFLFNIQVFPQASKIELIGRALYCYRKPAHETLVSAYSPDFFELCKRKYTMEQDFLRRTGADTFENRQLIAESYIKHLISVFIKNRSPKAALSVKEQYRRIRAALTDELTVAVLRGYKTTGLFYKIIVFIFKHRLVVLSHFMAVAASFVQTKLKK